MRPVIQAQKRLAFVVPRFEEGIAGGAETLIGNLAVRAQAQGHQVKVLTTCARDNRSWENYFEPGRVTEFGLPVERFLVDERDLDSWIPKQIAICEGMHLSVDDQLDWMAESVNSSALYRYIEENVDNHDAFFFGPYLFGTTFWGSLIHPERSYLIPCLHDEHYAYTDVIKSMFRQVSGALFNAIPEQQLAERIYGAIPGGEVGMGFVVPEAGFVKGLTPFFSDLFPYLLYVGRKETGKNVQLLIDYFISGKESGTLPQELKLVIVGGGDFSDLERPAATSREDIVDLAHVSEVDKQRLIKHAQLLVQPSVNESFSIVLMEAWAVGTPVLVHGDCAVTRHHVIESNGGLYFADVNEFCAVVSECHASSVLRDTLALSGKEYLVEKYSWDAVMERFNMIVESLLQ